MGGGPRQPPVPISSSVRHQRRYRPTRERRTAAPANLDDGRGRENDQAPGSLPRQAPTGPDRTADLLSQRVDATSLADHRLKVLCRDATRPPSALGKLRSRRPSLLRFRCTSASTGRPRTTRNGHPRPERDDRLWGQVRLTPSRRLARAVANQRNRWRRRSIQCLVFGG